MFSSFKISSDSGNVVYRADQHTDGLAELFRVPVAGGPRIRLNGPLPPWGKVEEYVLSADASNVVFTARTQLSAKSELFVVPIDGGVPFMSADTGGAGDVLRRIQITPDGARVVFQRLSNTLDDLFTVPTEGGPVVALSDNPGENLGSFLISEDSSSVLYNVRTPHRLYRASLASGSFAELSDGIDVRSVSQIAWTADTAIAYWVSVGDLLYGTWQDADPDGDGIHAGCDCDDASASHRAIEVNDGLDNQCPGDAGLGLVDELEGTAGFFDPATPTDLRWNAQPGATRYEVVRSGDRGFVATCACALTRENRLRIDERPPAGGVYYYLPWAAAPHRGSAGAESTGLERSGPCLATACTFGAL